MLATISDKKFGVPSGGSSLIAYYEPDIITAQDYFPFGMISREALPSGNVPYKFGFNGKMNDNDVKGGFGLQQDYGMRIYDPRVGRFLSEDPITKNYPELTPYQFASNTPICAIDRDGLEAAPFAMGASANYAEGRLANKAANGDEKAQAAFNAMISARIKIGGLQAAVGIFGGLSLAGGESLFLTSEGAWAIRPLLTNALKLGGIGAVSGAGFSIAKGDDLHDILKSTASGAIGGAVMALPWGKSLQAILISGGHLDQ